MDAVPYVIREGGERSGEKYVVTEVTTPGDGRKLHGDEDGRKKAPAWQAGAL